MIRANINDPERAPERKRAHYTNVATSEVFFESTPSVLIQITFVLTILSTHDIPSGQREFKEIVNTDSDWRKFVFSTSFASSVISSAFGVSRSAYYYAYLVIAHFLKMFTWLFRTLLFGVCRTISPVGHCEGAFGARFLLVFLATFASIINKALCMCVIIHFIEEDHYRSEFKVIFLILLFLFQLIMSLMSTTGFFNLEFGETFKLICHHPDLILLPLGKHLICAFTFLCFIVKPCPQTLSPKPP